MNYFPFVQGMIQTGLNLAKVVSPVVLGFVGIAFLIRAIYLQVSFAGAAQYGALLKDTFLCFSLIHAFPLIFSIILLASSDLADGLKTAGVNYAFDKAELSGKSVAALKNSEFAEKYVPGGKATLLQMVTAKTLSFWMILGLRFVQSAVYYIALFVYGIVTAFMCAAAPIIIFMATMVGISIGIRLFFGGLIFLTSWPIFWNLIGALADGILQSGAYSTIGCTLAFLLFSLFQLISPLWIKKFFISGSMSAIPGAAKTAFNGVNAIRTGGISMVNKIVPRAASVNITSGVPTPNAPVKTGASYSGSKWMDSGKKREATWH